MSAEESTAGPSDAVWARLASLCAELGDADPAGFEPGASFTEMGLDSLGLMELVELAEHLAGSAFPEPLIESWATLDDVAHSVRQALEQGQESQVRGRDGLRVGLTAVPAGGVGQPRPDTATNPVTSGRHVLLRPVEPIDYQYLYRLMSDPAVAFRWRLRGVLPSPEQFSQLIWENCLTQFMVCGRHDNAALGLVNAFAADQRNRHCHVGVLLDEPARMTGWALEAAMMFCHYLFTVWDFRKLYFESAEFNAASFSSGAVQFLRPEGRLVGHEHYDGRFWDLCTFALWRDDFYAQDAVRRLVEAGENKT